MYCGTLPSTRPPIMLCTKPGSRASQLQRALPTPDASGTHGDTSTTGPTILSAAHGEIDNAYSQWIQ